MSEARRHNYRLFDLGVASDLELPFARTDRGDVDVVVQEEPGLERNLDLDRLGEFADGHYGMQCGGWLFSISVRRREIRYQRRVLGGFELPLHHMLERRVLPVYATVRDDRTLCLHAGGISDGRRSWLVIGPSGAGKSSTIYVLIRDFGLRAVSDEMAVVDLGDGKLLPGAPGLRLDWAEREVTAAVESGEVHPDLSKQWFRLERDRLAEEPTELTGIVVLDPLEPDASRSEGLERVRGGKSLTILLEQTFDFESAPKSWKRRRFRNTRELAEMVPLYTFRYCRASSGRPEHVEQLWRDLSAASPGPSG